MNMVMNVQRKLSTDQTTRENRSFRSTQYLNEPSISGVPVNGKFLEFIPGISCEHVWLTIYADTGGFSKANCDICKASCERKNGVITMYTAYGVK